MAQAREILSRRGSRPRAAASPRPLG